ncbi:hypothetical protein dsx2_2941 [Desulfovibrio sp. X2]|uniref:GAK system XXXCH domain-containing protein n=1 Tax=Desulfovibrio sp. X2 TaxID=941449 RepID=UPI000358EE7B|nr:GAK system XXXCH domain-containing protein [Desulfovibrio sp. X2]EPR41937.1 hypothetical protein dsx2_2941 [Desulfovibrio sp. X2]
MAGRKSKVEFVMARERMAEFFRKLADAVQDGSVELDGGSLDLHDFSKLKVSVKASGGAYLISLGVKKEEKEAPSVCVCTTEVCTCGAAPGSPRAAEAAEAPKAPAKAAAKTGAKAAAKAPRAKAPETAGPGGKPRYKGLKKRLKEHWKAVRDALLAGNLPEDAAYEAFAAEFKAMLTYPGKGEEHYAANAEALRELAEAMRTRDIAEVRLAAAMIDKLKKECHARYK